MTAFIDSQRSQGHGVEPVCEVLRSLGVKVSARSYQHWKRPGRVPSARAVRDEKVRAVMTSMAVRRRPDGSLGPSAESLYGRRKWRATLARQGVQAGRGCVDRAVRHLGLSGVTRAKAPVTTVRAKNGVRAGDLLNRDFTAPAPNKVWVTDFTYVRTGVRRLHRRRLRPADRRVARRHEQGREPGRGPAAPGPVGQE